VSAPAVNWSPDPSEMSGLLTKIPLRNKIILVVQKNTGRRRSQRLIKVEDIKI
jgi:hypothetical protein